MPGRAFGLALSFLSNRRLWVVLAANSVHRYIVNAGIPQGSIFGVTLSMLYVDDLPDDLICNIAINTDDIILYSNCGQASDLWQ